MTEDSCRLLALPRLYERLREEKVNQLDDDDEADSSQINKRQGNCENVSEENHCRYI